MLLLFYYDYALLFLCVSMAMIQWSPPSAAATIVADASFKSSISAPFLQTSSSASSRTNILSALMLHNHDHQRNLQQKQQEEELDKFSALNEIFSTIELQLPDAPVSRSGLDLTITELVCRDLNVQGIQISHDIVSNTKQRIGVDVAGVHISCTFDWEYSWMFFSGSGSGTAISDQPTSSISMGVDFISQDYATHPPQDVSIENCDANLQIADIQVEDDGIGLMAGIVNIFEGLVRDTIEEELGDVVCDEINKLAEEGGALDDMLVMVSDSIDTFLGGGGGDSLDDVDTDPLSAEKNAEIPTDEDGKSLWVNFQELQDYTRELLDLELNQLMESILGSSSGGDEDELGINVFLRDNILNEDGLLVIDPSSIITSDNDDSTLFEMHDMFTQTTMSIQSLSIGGLDSFTEMDVLDPIGNYTLQNEFRLEYLTLSLEMEAVIQASSKSDAVITTTEDEPTMIRETFLIEFTVNDVNVDFAIFLGINTQTLGSIPLGSIVYTENILPCILGAVDEVEFTAVSATVSDMEPPSLSGFLDDSMDHIITSGAEALFSMYEQVLIQAMPSFVEMTLRDLLNDFIDDALDDAAGACPKPDDTLIDLVDYRDLLLSEEEAVELLGRGGSPYGELFRLLYGFLDEVLSSVDDDGLSWLNALIMQFTGLQTDDAGNIFFAGDLIRQSLDISLNGLNAFIEIGVSDVTVSNLDSLGALHLLQPMMGESSVLNNTASIGVGPEAIRMEMTILIKGKGDKVDVHNEFELGLSLKDVVVVLEVLAQMQEQPFLNFPLQDVTNLNCWMATIVAPVLDKYGIRIQDGEADTGLVLRNLLVAVAEARLDMNCISCSSQMMLELEQSMQSQEGITDTTEVANQILNYGSNLLGGDYVQSGIDQILNEAAYHCPHSPSYQQNFPGLEYEDLEPIETNDETYEFLIAIIVVVLVVAVSATVIFFITRLLSRRRHSRWMKTLNKPQKLELARMQQDEKEREKDLNKRMNSLLRSKEIPCVVRLLIPIVIIGNIGLFLSGHLSLGGTVNLSGSFAGTEFNVDGFFEFSMAKSTIEMWQAGATALAILIALFSGVWPYTKQVLTLLIWLTPPRWMSSSRRGKVLHWLDVLGKWSMVDVFVLLMTLASFRLSVESPDHLSFLPEDLYSINMLVVPMWGLYANLLAQLVAQISSHVIIHYHRKTVNAATKSQAIELNLEPPSELGNTQEKLSQHNFKLDYEASYERAIIRKGVDYLLLSVLLSFMVLVICGCSLPSFNIEVLGLVGLVVESGNRFEQAKTYYSVFDLASMLMDQARYINKASDYLGLGTLASLLVITVFIVPLAQAVSLLVQWFAPMTKKQRAQNTAFNEILSAWQYMEVYVLSIIIAAWQLGGVSEFMINAYCDSLQDTFTMLVHYGVLEKEDAQCFRVDATVEAASWLLVASSLVLCILNHFIGAAALQKAQDGDTPTERRLHTDRWLQGKPPQSVLTDDRVNTMGEDVEEGTKPIEHDDKRVKVLPISPRFTDYYYFATVHQTEEELGRDSDMENAGVETAVVPKDINGKKGEGHKDILLIKNES
ncbi:hypothetical protein ACHAXR_008950 [Thalassiosira sp. AJA248-18]